MRKEENRMLLRCKKEIEGFTEGKTYKLLGCVAEYVQLKNDNKEKVIIYEGYFDIVS